MCCILAPVHSRDTKWDERNKLLVIVLKQTNVEGEMLLIIKFKIQRKVIAQNDITKLQHK